MAAEQQIIPHRPPAEAPAEPRAALEIDRVSVTFDKQPVLRGLSFDIPRGQTACVIGESGCGKTVLLKLIVGLLRPTVGQVRVDGRVLADLPERELVRERLRVGFLFQGAALFDSLTVYENVSFGLRAQRKFGDAETRDAVAQRLREVGLSPDIAPKMPSQLSGGMRKRVALARALILNPDVMLYDEPTTGLDPIMSDVINELILRTRQARHITSVVVTHDMTTVRKVADRVAMLYPLADLADDAPQLIFDGPPDQLGENPDDRVRQFVTGDARGRL